MASVVLYWRRLRRTMKQRTPLLSPARLARAMLVGIVGSGVLTSGIAMAAGFRPPPSPAPFNNVPELIWNAQESGFVPQDASFTITGSGVLGSLTASGAVKAAQFAGGGYDPDPGGIAITAPSVYGDAIAAGGHALDPLFAITTPSMYATALEVNSGTVYGTLVIDPATGGISLGGVTRTSWPSGISSIIAGDNLTGGGATGDVTVGLDPNPSVNTLSTNTLNVGASALIPEVSFDSGILARIRWNAPTSQLRFEGPNLFMNGVNTTAGSVSTFSGPVNVTGGSALTVQGRVAAVSLCALGGTACASAPHSLSETVSGATICIGSDCRTSWPAGGGGGGGGTVTSVGSGTGLTGGPITTSGSLALDTGYTDGRYVNATGDSGMSGTFQISTGNLNVIANTASDAVRGGNSGSGPGVRGDAQGGTGVLGTAVSGTGVYGSSDSGIGVRGLSTGNYGLLAQGSTGARILNNAGIITSLAQSTDGVNTTGRVVAPEYCIGASCITAWPSGGGGGDYVLRTGDTMTGDLTITGTGSQLDVNSGSVGPAIRGESSGERGVLGVSTSGGLAGVYGSGTGGPGVQGVSGSSYGVLGQTTSGIAAGYFTRGSAWTQLTTATDGLATNANITVTGAGRVTSPQYCIGASCITSWPGGGVTSLSAGTGITLSPSTITSTGSISLDTGYADGRYLNTSGFDTFNGTELTVIGNSGFSALDVDNNGTGRGLRVQNGGSSPTILAQNGSTGNAGTFTNAAGASVELARGGQAIYAYGPSASYIDDLNVDIFEGISGFGDWTTVTRENVAIPSGWTNAPTACPAGYKVTGISCFNWDSGRNYPGCTSKKGSAPDNSIQLYGTGFNVTYTLYCAKLP